MNDLFSTFYCTKCGNKTIPIQRKAGRLREPGHLKKLFCLTCGKEMNCAECKDGGKYRYEHFVIEFENGNFDEEGNRIEPNFKIFVNSLREKE